MKKHLLFIVLLFISCSTFAQLRKHSDKSNWSFTLETGINQFDGDMYQNYNSVVPNGDFHLSYGGSVEYNFTPVWGLGVEFYHLPLSAKQGNDYFTSDLNHFNAYLSINMLNLFSRDIDTRWGIWGTLGGGLAFYNSMIYGNNSTVGIPLKNGLAITVPVGAILEYNYTKSIALGFKLQYRSHNKDNLEGNLLDDNGVSKYNYKGVTNDFVSLATVLVRWKFNANRKDHARNLNDKIYQPEEAMIPARQAKAKADSLQSKVDSLRQEVSQIKPKIEKIEKALELGTLPKIEPETTPQPVPVKEEKPATVTVKNPNGDDDGDGVPNSRDKEPDTAKNKAVDYWGVTIRGVNVNGFGTVYFGFNKYDLDQQALDMIRTVAVKLNTDPLLLLEIRGFADNVGNVEYNQRLSQKRADIVKDYLVRVYKVSPDRIIANGKGKIIDMLGENRMNRRCNFYFNE